LFKRNPIRLNPVVSGRTGAQLAHRWRIERADSTAAEGFAMIQA
jgi:hypothetical protein